MLGLRPSPSLPSSFSMSQSQRLLGQARAHAALNEKDTHQLFIAAANHARVELDSDPHNQEKQETFNTIQKEYVCFLAGGSKNYGVGSSSHPAPSSSSIKHTETPIQQSEVTSQGAPPKQSIVVDIGHAQPLSITTQSALSQQQPVAFSIQTKSELVDYLFGKMISTLGSLKIANTPSLFLVYAHDNSTQGKAEATISRYLIKALTQIRTLNLYSDQTPLGQPYSDVRTTWKQDGQLSDILTSQFCLLPDQLTDDVRPVDKVVVCCSEVLGNYLKGWPHYEDFYQALQKAYGQDLERKSTSAVRKIVNEFSQKDDFHHVLTEMAFLRIRAEKRGDQHNIIPVSLTPNSYEQCLAHFIPATTVRIGDIPRLKRQAKAGEVIFLNQGQHGVLFKLIERLLVGNNEATIFLDKFWKGYGELLAWLKNEPSTSTLGGHSLELVKSIDHIFDDIERELHGELFSTVRQFCDSDWQQAATQLLNQLQHLFPLCMQQAETLQKLLPQSSSSIELREALRRHYERSSDLSIQRVSGEKVSLDDCYINLAIVESRAQREKDKEELEQRASSFERLPSGELVEAANLNKLIQLEELFDIQKLSDGSEGLPKRILIQGRAGIGKTILCKKLVYEYHHNKLWQDKFDCVLWIPLRQLKTFSPQRFEELLCNHYFRSHEESRAKALTQAFYNYLDKTLFILDGLDEVIDELDEGRPLKGFLEELFNQKHVVITSRPAGVDTRLLGSLDLVLETIGFSSDNVQDYIEKFAPEPNQAAIQQFIDSTPIVQSLVNIPIQLDALCYSWDRLPKNQFVTMSMLYESMVEKLWRKDSIRLEKQDKGKPLAANVIQQASKIKLEKLMEDEIHYLGYLAFKGLTQGKIEFSVEELDQCQAEIEECFAEKVLPFSFTHDLKKTSYLHTVDAERPEAERYYHFLHLTFQEFFAAKFLTKHLQAYAKAANSSISAYGVQRSLDVIPAPDELEGFIATNKYNPRYEIVWWMVAGLLRGAALENFFHILNQAPRDLIGMRHQQVIMGCLNEARIRLKKATIDNLERELQQWLSYELFGVEGPSGLGCQVAFPESILLKFLEKLRSLPEKEDISTKVILTLTARTALSSKAIEVLSKVLEENKNQHTRAAVAQALGEQQILPECAAEALAKALKDESFEVRNEAVDALNINYKKLTNEKIKQAFVSAYEEDPRYSPDDDEDNPRILFQPSLSWRHEMSMPLSAAFKIKLELTETLSDIEIQSLIATFKDHQQDEEKRQSAVYKLSKQRVFSNCVINVLCAALQDKVASVRFKAAHTLYLHRKLPDRIIESLYSLLRDENNKVRRAAVDTLAHQKSLPDNTVEKLITDLKSTRAGDKEISSNIIKILNQQEKLPEEALLSLVVELEGPSKTWKAAVKILTGHFNQLYRLFPKLSSRQIELLYYLVLFPRSCQHIVALYIQNSKLYFYTGTGLEETIHLNPGQDQIVEAFENAQAKMASFWEPALIEWSGQG